MEPLAAKFGRELYRLRQSRGLTRKQAAIEVNLSLNALSSIENGMALVKLDTLVRMLQVYGIGVDQFMREMAEPAVAQPRQAAESFQFATGARYFILDTKGEGTANNYADSDFVAYSWHPRHFGKVREGDWFIYRRPQSASETNSWYLFGAGQIGQITPLPDGRVTAQIEHPFPFPAYLLADPDLQDFKWEFKDRVRPDWQRFFNQYGMTEIKRGDFVNLLAQAHVPNDVALLSESGHVYQQILEGEYLFTERAATMKVRIGQNVLAERVKANYAYRCAVTGINTRSLLVASHIIPWKDSARKRLDPGNVICLSPLWDRAFDQGLVTFTPDEKKVVLSPAIQHDPALERLLVPYADRRLLLPRHAAPEAEALQYHYQNIFKH
ncbi:HNH endonuclease [Lacticaseibacillus jixianensis]|uniref:HNH endonuclease n=1 Tax=Lacticaseibacillus jixianensis TaxID=2486012 RepID=A0ABW4BA20_9LACO|nr:HNH endonuclease [Lacticaseibacillus jixianensis]